MNYKEAKALLDKHIDTMPKGVQLFMAPEPLEQMRKIRLKAINGDNEAVLKEFGYIENSNLEVYATYQDGGNVYYPTLSYYLQIQQSLKDQ